MNHLIRRSPVDIYELRGEAKVVVGNAGVVEIIRTGSAVGRDPATRGRLRIRAYRD